MRRLLAVLSTILLPCLAADATATEPVVEFTRIQQTHRTDDSFKRISEFFTGTENTGNRIVFRTTEDERTGFYLSFRLEAAKGERIPPGTIHLFYFPYGEFETEEVSFNLPPTDRRKVEIMIGLTGPEWSDPDARPVAWMMELLDAAGEPLGTMKSFLWELPDENDEPRTP